MVGARVCAPRHACYMLLTVAVLTLYYGAGPWYTALKPDVISVWGPAVERNLSRYIRPWKRTALLLPQENCKDDQFLILVVPSKSSNYQHRRAIRDTWGQWVRGPSSTIPQYIGGRYRGHTRALQDLQYTSQDIKNRDVESQYTKGVKKKLPVPSLQYIEQRRKQRHKHMATSVQETNQTKSNLINTPQLTLAMSTVPSVTSNSEPDSGSYYFIWEDYLDDDQKQLTDDGDRIKRQTERSIMKDSGLDKDQTYKSKILTKRKVFSSKAKSPFVKLDPSLKLKLVFLLGLDTDSDKPNETILKEHHKYGDIVLEDFVDAYQNLTLKSVYMLKYIKDHCPTVKFVAKVDDDMFVHVPNLHKTLLDKNLPEKLMLGCLFCNARPILNPWNKWYSPSYMYKGDKFPNYLSGTSYVMSGNMIAPLLETAMHTPLYHLEDVFITGILTKKLGVRPTDSVGFSYQARPLNPCLYQNVTVGHEVNPDHMYRLWNLLHLDAITRACKPLAAVHIRKYKPTNCVWR
uniref:Beta-1,3-galactosyltransferase bre-2-like n=1 Tax=Hirondellea gigas TaxID=1518452 RepID=A0A2P2I3N3_9CRUS